jgi:2'-5' RNA ligase
VPVDSTRFGVFFADVFTQGVLLDFAYQYAENKQDLLQIYRNAQNFATNFQVSPQDYQDFLTFARKQGVKSQPKANEQIIIKNYLKAYIGKRSFDENALYATLFATDQTAIKALQVLNSSNGSAVAYRK